MLMQKDGDNSMEHAAQTAEGTTDLPIQPAAADYETVITLRQRHTWLSDDDIAKLVAGYKAGLSIYQLAQQFGCHRQTVSRSPKNHGTKMRGRPLTEEQIDGVQMRGPQARECAGCSTTTHNADTGRD
jgi:hypothetical protein